MTVGFDVTCPTTTETTNIGTHIGTHIGKASGSGEGVAVLDFSPGGACVDENGLDGVDFTIDFDNVIVAADGSELHTVTEGSGCFVDLAVPIDTSGTFTIVGGTGRFDDAIGGGMFTNDGRPDGGFVGRNVGTIGY